MAEVLGASPLQVLAVLGGVAAHVSLFRVGEWDRSLPKIAGTLITANLAAAAVISYVLTNGGISVAGALKDTSKLTAWWVVGVYASMLIYRVFFHRLHRFPGPFMGRVSNLNTTRLSVKEFKLFKEIQALHKKHGDFVRIGPRELSINNADAVDVVHSARSKCTKGPWYSIHHPQVSLQQTRNKLEHSRRRKIWDKAFNSKNIREYEPRVTGHTEQLLTQIERLHNEPINVTDWFNFYSFDVMGDLSFGKSFGMLQEGVVHYFMKALHGFMKVVGIFSRMGYVFPIFRMTPVLNAEDKKFWRFVVDETEGRRKNPPSRPDIMSWLLEEYEQKKSHTYQERVNLYGDSQLIIVAGSDTTAATLTTLFFELSQHPKVQQALQQEIDQLFDDAGADVIDAQSLSKLSYLNAVIQETLRLHPPVPSGLQRVTPYGGVEIAGTFIPGDTIVQVPIYTLQRDARNFPRPDEFIPERWTTMPELVKEEKCYMPFSTGPDGCVGKQLGLMEVRQVTSQLVRRYSVKFAPGQKPEDFENSIEDTFTTALGPLRLKFDDRKHVHGKA
ncbi:cytochrome p450 monooxygenase [Pseudovirgaria hyperparasitica]|uniref:Cytochrome p450 monooxygenase n=1 Tax=Pseudovirgaria hyperparasitica TaxID=470096 RepID=A0A6A6W595_9PEZI|nr:cytochrome p450 monooxygenase [Pseudovirgaria hyperparasitica]KAF2757126.1 cytochrome p450 monooxygenase [Pseudovirgaria hyperparasitica]